MCSGSAVWFAFGSTGRLRVLPLPFALFLRREESHLGRFSLAAPAIFDDLHVAIDLDLVQGVLFVFAVARPEPSRVLQLRVLEGCAEIGIEPRATILENHKLFVKARRIELRVLGSFKAFEPAHGFIDASIH